MVKVVANIGIPRKIRGFVFRSLGKTLLGMTDDDFRLMVKPLSEYKDINDFFTRKIDLKKREIHYHKIISPCEGKVMEYGLVQNNGYLAQVKGINYSLERLILNNSLSAYFKRGSFCNIYLSPRNYHRFHSPCSGTIDYIKHIPGACYPVNDMGQKIPGLYTLNERYIVSIKNSDFRICLAIVGAAAVRRINIFKKPGDVIIKGEMLGMFELGSSIVMISDKKIFSVPNVLIGDVKVLGPILQRDDL
ncbi:MAG: archaetidylserine decarboxylase [Proteobacteria bacterium]|nr:archaetidylserine decarboxylase [Pseudomonadota bacterium]